jgi:iron(III) transport system permease protein
LRLPKLLSTAQKRNYFNGWVAATSVMVAAVALPLLIIFLRLFEPGDTAWEHITARLLPGYVINTLFLMAGVAILVLVFGVTTAWMTSMYRFPGRKFFRWAMVLPIAIPPYILGFTWVAMLDYTSPLYVFLRNNFGVETGQFLFFDLLSLPGAIVIFALSLYPYVYLICRNWFIKQSASVFEAAASLGHKPLVVFFRIALPMARPAMVAGVSLALMEVLNDYGVVSYFGIDTFTTGIFTAWFAFGSPISAIKLSGYLMVFVLFLLLTERMQRGQKRYDSLGGNYKPTHKKELRGIKGVLASFFVAIPVVFGFFLPLLMIIIWSFQTAGDVLEFRFLSLFGNSLFLAGITAVILLLPAVVTGFTVRTFPTRTVRIMARVATLGYAIPGAVVAIGILIPFLWFDGYISQLTGGVSRLLITGTWFTLVFAYVVRFMAVGYNNIESSMERTSTSLDEASRSLGVSPRRTLGKILLPLIRPGILAAALLVFIDVLKELPLTLILRPFNFDTLAIRAFEYASDERVPEAAPASLIIIITGLIAVLLLNKTMNNKSL